MKIAIIICLILTTFRLRINEREIDLRSLFGALALILFLIRG